MDPSAYPIPVTEHTVHANGLDIWYIEAGEGIPLILLHGGLVSNGPIWADHEWGWGAYLGAFAQHFRVIAPDTRGHGRTLNPSGVHTFPAYAEDVIALIQALRLDRPLVCGFSDGGHTASLVGILAPELSRAIVNLAGYDYFSPDPEHPTRVAIRQGLGGSRHATRADVGPYYDLKVRQDPYNPMRRRSIADYEPAQGAGYLRQYYENIFERCTVPMGYTLNDFSKITAPTLILVGDRDEFCSVEEGVSAYRALPHGELGIIPNMRHTINSLVCTVANDFLLRHQG